MGKRPDVAENNKLLKTKEGIKGRYQFRFDAEETAEGFRELLIDRLITSDDLEGLQALFNRLGQGD